MAYFRTEWLMSTICASRAIESITPRQIAAAPSGPKSVRKPMTGWPLMARDRSRRNRDGAGRRSGAVSGLRERRGGVPRSLVNSGFGRVDDVGRAGARSASVVHSLPCGGAGANGPRRQALLGSVLQAAAKDCLDLGQRPVEPGAWKTVEK